MADIFDRLTIQIPSNRDIFDRLEDLDIMDRVDLPVEDKVIFSPEMKKLIREELYKEINNIPVGQIISKIMEKEIAKQKSFEGVVKKTIEDEVVKKGSAIEDQFKEFKKEIEEFKDKLKEKYADLRNSLATTTHPRYEFGGFSPQFNLLVIGPDATEGSWRIVIDGSNLSVQRYESGVWVEKGSFNP